MLGKLFVQIRQQWMGALALFLVLGGGTAYAANTVGSSDIIDESILSQDLKNGEVKSVDIGNNQVTSTDVRDDTLSNGGLGSVDIADGQIGSADLAAGAVNSASVTAYPCPSRVYRTSFRSRSSSSTSRTDRREPGARAEL